MGNRIFKKFRATFVPKGLIIVTFIFLSTMESTAQDSLVLNGFQRFYYQNGVVSSEGTMRDGKPDGFWRAFYENGKIKSEGFRKNFELDSTWKFYNEDGKLTLEINYAGGKKNGIKTTYLDKETVKENFLNDVKEGITRIYYPEGALKQEIPFVKGIEQGIGKEFSPDGNVITIIEYKRGFVTDRIKINRRDKNNLRQGTWMTFYPNGKIQLEGTYKDDRKNGYFKEYTESGDLVKVEKYVNDVLQPDAAEVAKLDVIRDYYPDGQLKSVSMYRNGILEGISSEYSKDGKITGSIEYRNGKKAGEGIILEDGSKDGAWKEYYSDGSLRAEGTYSAGRKIGEWKYYHPNGSVEQAGKYNKQGSPEGTWRWYYENGDLHREENYYNGKLDGLSEEWDENGILIEKGEYLEGEEDGPWTYTLGDFAYRGSYRDGLRTGMWYTYYLFPNGQVTDSVLSFKGNFIDDLPDGKHQYYWDNGKLKEEGTYVMGRKEGDWLLYNSDGTLFLIITYLNGTEVKYDGIKIKPPFDKEE